MNRYINSEILAILGACALMAGDYVARREGAWPGGADTLDIAGIVLLMAAFVAAFFPDKEGE